VQIVAVEQAAEGADRRYGIRSTDGSLAADGLTVEEFAARAAELEADEPTWVFPAAERLYPVLLAAGVRVRRCHDLQLAEGLLLAHDGRHAEPRALPAAYARARGLEPPPDEHPENAEAQGVLFDARGSGLPAGVDAVEAAAVVLGEQQRRLGGLPAAERMRLLVASESASALVAAEMSDDGLPWDADGHRELLEEMLGPRVAGGRPAKLAALAEQIAAAFGGRPVNPDHPPSVVRAFAHAGVDVPSSRAWVLADVDHPAVEPLLQYKELARLHSAHGWTWLAEWVHGGRFRPVFVVGGLVSGRWASRGGGALQIPKTLRVCVRADPGWQLVVADAAQLEPRVLAAISGDERLAEVSTSADLYAGLAEDTFDGERPRAKIALLSAMYGGTSGEAGPLLAVLRKWFPVAVDYVEQAARAGERGELVRSRLGRTSPPPSERWRTLTGHPDGDHAARRAAKDWGRFTRNFVVQASAADWTSVLLALLRSKLRQRTPAAQLVFFLHDEVIVHCQDADAEVVRELFDDCAREAARMVFGPQCPVRFPLAGTVVDCYADAK
jgi:DNA polymerase-1